MADSAHLRLLQAGAHASVNDFTADAGATYFLEPIGQIDTSGLTQGKLDKDTLRGDNEYNARVNGPKAASISFSLLGRGLSGNDGTVTAAGDQEELSPLLAHAFAFGPGVGGQGTTVSTNTEASALIVQSGTSGIGTGEGIGFYADDSTEWIVREVQSIATNNLTLDRGGWTGSATGQEIYGGLTYFIDADDHDVVHHYFDIEGENFRRKVYGAMCETVTINIPGNGGQVTFDFSFRASDWSDVAEANPTFSAPTVGSDIVALNSPFFMGDGGATYADDTEWFVDGITIQIQNQLQPRVTPSGANGFVGFHVAKRTVTISGNMYLGALTSDATDALLALLNTSGQTMDCGMQVGSGPGASLYWRAPNVDFDAQPTIINGMDAISFTGHCRRSSNHSNVPGAFRLHLF